MASTVRCNTCKFGDWGYVYLPGEKCPCEACIGFSKWQPKGGVPVGKITVEDLDAFQQNIAALKEDYADARQRFIEQNCPHGIGDIVTINGYVFQGKKMVIDKIFLAEKWQGGYEYHLYGRVIKKSGRPGIQTADFRTTFGMKMGGK